jgi:hypothetical protein
LDRDFDVESAIQDYCKKKYPGYNWYYLDECVLTGERDETDLERKQRLSQERESWSARKEHTKKIIKNLMKLHELKKEDLD